MRSSTLIALFVILFSSCNKESSVVGKSVVESNVSKRSSINYESATSEDINLMVEALGQDFTIEELNQILDSSNKCNF